MDPNQMPAAFGSLAYHWALSELLGRIDQISNLPLAAAPLEGAPVKSEEEVSQPPQDPSPLMVSLPPLSFPFQPPELTPIGPALPFLPLRVSKARTCRFCAIHGVSAILITGHKGLCPYRDCHCNGCQVLKAQNVLMRDAMRERRREKKQRRQGFAKCGTDKKDL